MATAVMVNGLPGNMAKEVLMAAKNRGLTLVPYSLTGPGIDTKTVDVDGESFTLVTPEERDTIIEEIKAKYAPFITVDYTHPTAVNNNAEFYIEKELPFVMGTTGGDREKLTTDVDNAGLYAVIAPNMAKQIVAMQAMLEEMQKSYPGVYKNYTLSVVESHQATKADTSGTAKAIVDTFNEMGLDKITYDDIEKVRDEKEQVERMDVPGEYLTGHAYHTYRIESYDKTVAFEYRHNVNGRQIYAEGTVDAVLFLGQQIADGTRQKLFNMIDILKAGAMN